MTGFVYKWTNQINGRWYIGSHKGTTDDGYRHSSKILATAEKKYGIKNFTRKILFEGDYEKDKIRSVKEAAYLREKDAANNPMSYNQTNITGPNCFSIEHRQKLAAAKIGVKRSKAVCEILSKSHMGIKFTEERCRNISLAKLGVKRSKAVCEAQSKRQLGVKRSKATCEAISKGKKGIPQKVVTCPHCQKAGGVSIMHRYHFDRCKLLKT